MCRYNAKSSWIFSTLILVKSESEGREERDVVSMTARRGNLERRRKKLFFPSGEYNFSDTSERARERPKNNDDGKLVSTFFYDPEKEKSEWLKPSQALTIMSSEYKSIFSLLHFAPCQRREQKKCPSWNQGNGTMWLIHNPLESHPGR